MRALRSGLRALGALLVLLLLLVGIPAALAITGNPLAALPDLLAGDVTDTGVIAILATVAWVAWAQFAVATLAELLGALRRRPAPRIPGVFGGQQQLARALVLGVFVLSSANSVAHTSQASAATPMTGRASTNSVTQQLHPAPPQNALAHPTVSAHPGAAARHQQPTTLYTVRPLGAGPGTLWDIAQDQFGDGARWREIWQLNEGRQQADGATMSSASFLRPGWTVRVPAHGQAKGQASAPSHAPTPSTEVVEVTVQGGDTLSDLAATHGQADWQLAWHANAGRTEPGGARFTDPDLLRPGWNLALPGSAAAGAPSAPSAQAPAAAAPSAPAAPPAATAPERPTQQPRPVEPPPAPVHVAPAQPEPAPLHGLGSPAPAAAGPVRPAAPAAQTTVAPSVRSVPSTAASAAHDGWSQGRHVQQSEPSQHDQHGAHDDQHVDEADHAISSVTMVALLGGGGAMLAAGAVAALLRLRRRRFRERTLGKTISSTPDVLAPMEKALLARSAAGVPDVTWLDGALQQLVWATGAQGAEVPETAAARLSATALELVLTVVRTDAPAPWQADDTGLRWTVQRSDLDTADPPHHTADDDLMVVPPYPALVSVGYSDDGEHWLLDLERIGAVALTGDPERCLDLARFLAAELAHNSWAELLHVDLVGFGAELAPLQRVTHHQDGAAAVQSMRGALRQNTRALQEWDSTVLHGRVHADDVGDGWPPRVLLVAPTGPAGEGPDGLQALLEALRAQRGRTAVAVVVSGDSVHTGDTRWQLHLDSQGRLTIPALDVTLTAQQVPAHEAADLAALIALAATGADEPMPAAAGDQHRDALTDAAGAPLPALVSGRDRLEQGAGGPDAEAGDTADEPPARSVVTDLLTHYTASTSTGTGDAHKDAHEVAARPAAGERVGPADKPAAGDVTSVLPRPAAAYLPVTATTVEDVVALAPAISADARELIEAESAALDADLAAWRDDRSDRAKLTLLGPVDLRAHGTEPPNSLLRYTEVVAFLAAHPQGVTTAELIAGFWPEESDRAAGGRRARNYLSNARTWLGEDPQTREAYLPVANRDKGPGVYQLSRRLLTDPELFRKLRLRGVARGDAGLVDLQAALALVTGSPLQHRREDGYGWLVDTPLEQIYTAAIVDTAHLVADICLAAADPAGAEAAARVSLLAGDSSDVALLDLVAAYDAMGDQAQAQAYVRRIMANHCAEVEEDLPPRTYEVLHRRRWLPSRGRTQAG